MSNLFVVDIAIWILSLILPLLRVVGILYTIPQRILNWIKKKWIEPYKISNCIQMTLFTFFYLIYILVFLNLHFILFFKYNMQINSYFKLVVSFLILNLFTAILYKDFNMNFSVNHEIPILFYFLFYTITFPILLICLILQLGRCSLDLKEYLTFNKHFRNVAEIFEFTLYEIFQTFKGLIVNVLMMLHIVNPISLSRAIPIIYNEKTWINSELIFTSFLHIFQDMFLILLYLFNLVFPFSFLKSHIKLIVDLFSGRYKKILNYSNSKIEEDLINIEFTKFERAVSYAKFYLYFKNVVILQNFRSNVRFAIVVILCAVNSIFIWKIPKVYKLLKNFLKNNDLTELFLNSVLEMVETFIEILTPIILIYNHVNPFNLISLYRLRNYYKHGVNEYSFTHMNLHIFINKAMDYFVTFFSLNINFTFVALFLRFRKSKRSLNFFPLLTENENFYLNGKINKSRYSENKSESITPYHSLETINGFFFNRRVKFAGYLLESIAPNFLLIICSISILDPFIGFKYFKCIYEFFHVNVNDLNGGIIKHKQLLHVFRTDLFKIFHKLLCDLIWYIPLSLIFTVTAPWNLKKLLVFIYQQSIGKQIPKFKNENMIEEYNNKIKNNPIHFEQRNQQLFSIIESWVNGWKIIIQFLLIHLTVFRGFLMWRNYSRYLSYKKEKLKTFKSNNQNMKFVRKHSINTQTLLNLSNSELLTHVISVHFHHFLRELFFYPFVFLIILITPWNVFELKPFATSNLFREKLVGFKVVFKKCLQDILYSVLTISLLVSVLKTLAVLRLLYYSFRKNFLRDENSIILYDTYYQADFHTEVRKIGGRILENFLIIVMLIVNIILITRILSVFRRLIVLIKKRIIQNYSKIKHMFDKKGSNKQKNFLHNSSNRIISSICEYLPPQSVSNLSLTSKTLFNKTQMNLIWQNMLNNYYKKCLKNSTSPEIYNLINADNFTDYKSACKEVSKYAGKRNELTESERDALIGVYNILLEETINSLLKIPHLILIPVKIIGYVLFKIVKIIIDIQGILTETKFFKNYLSDSCRIITFESMKDIDKDYHIWTWERVFLDTQILGFLSLFKIFIILLTNFINILTSVFTLIIKVVCLERLSLPEVREIKTYHEKLFNIKYNVLKVYQHLIGFGCIILHIYIFFYPIQYSFTEDYYALVSRYFSKNNWVLIGLSDYYSFLYEAYFMMLDKNLISEVSFYVGNKYTTFGMVVVNCLMILLMHKYLQKTNIIVYDVVKFFFAKNGLFEYLLSNLDKVFYYGLFPQVLLVRELEKVWKRNNLIDTIVLNILYLIFMLFPFYLNFKVPLNLYTILTINSYAMVNLFRLILPKS